MIGMFSFNFECRVLLKMLIFLLCLCPGNVEASSCSERVQFVIRCHNNICKEGFFALRKQTRNYCDSTLDVQSSTEVKQFDGELKGLNRGTLLHGYYAIETIGRYTHDIKRKTERCFGEDNSNRVTVICEIGEPWIVLKSLDYNPELSVRSVIEVMAQQSFNEKLISNLFKWSFPLMLVASFLLVVIRQHKNPSKYNIVFLFIFSLSGFIIGRWVGQAVWDVFGFLAILIIFFWKGFSLLKYAINRVRFRNATK